MHKTKAGQGERVIAGKLEKKKRTRVCVSMCVYACCCGCEGAVVEYRVPVGGMTRLFLAGDQMLCT